MTKSKYPERREELVRFVQAYLAEYGYTPSAVLLGRRLGWSKSTCQGYLRQLRAELGLPPTLPGYLRSYLTNRQPLLERIQNYTAQHGYAPSLRCLASVTGLSPNTLRGYLDRLRLEGLVDFDPGIPRSIRVIE